MYDDLASVREIVDLSPQEALNSAQAFLVQQGYRVVQRTDTSLVADRRKRQGNSEDTLLNLTVVAQPQPQGGIRIKVRGNDREGVQAQQAEWKHWADGLPKKDQQEGSEGTAAIGESENRIPSSGTQIQPDVPRVEHTSQEAQEGLPEELGPHERGPTFTERSAELQAAPSTYEYRMVQIPPGVSVRARDHVGDEAAQYLQSIANAQAEEGWEFYRVDTLTVSIPAGCLGALFGDGGTQNQYYVVTFRRPR